MKTISHYKNALIITPEDASLYTSMGNILQEHNQYTDALEAYKNAGINRLSIGLQSTENRILELIGRIHTYDEFLKTYNFFGSTSGKSSSDCLSSNNDDVFKIHFPSTPSTLNTVFLASFEKLYCPFTLAGRMTDSSLSLYTKFNIINSPHILFM